MFFWGGASHQLFSGDYHQFAINYTRPYALLNDPSIVTVSRFSISTSSQIGLGNEGRIQKDRTKHKLPEVLQVSVQSE